MKNLGAYKKQIKDVQELIEKLENGQLTIEELSHLELLTRELHERSIILRYKAFEDLSGGSVSINQIESEEYNLKEEDFEIEESESPAIDFSIFEESESATEEVELEAVDNSHYDECTDEPHIEVEEHISITVQPITNDATEELEKENVSADAGSSFLDRFTFNDTSVSSKFEGAKIETLVGAFGLNQKLLYINELFDGSSEMFSEAIKLLDSQANLIEAKEELDKIATRNSWNPEEETVIEFMGILKRRYA